mmetsp:Transcript_13964/g.19081  ORF Transcript_13964/g.19081 Transcript_13964/m.19081 type:complete len:92 (+) Transcript_13964:33-308(+)
MYLIMLNNLIFRHIAYTAYRYTYIKTTKISMEVPSSCLLTCRAEEDDVSIINELMELLQSPYDDGTAEQQQRWYHSTPYWARNLPGVAFMS